MSINELLFLSCQSLSLSLVPEARNVNAATMAEAIIVGCWDRGVGVVVDERSVHGVIASHCCYCCKRAEKNKIQRNGLLLWGRGEGERLSNIVALYMFLYSVIHVALLITSSISSLLHTMRGDGDGGGGHILYRVHNTTHKEKIGGLEGKCVATIHNKPFTPYDNFTPYLA